jgi:hypothetical protein
LHRVTGNAKRSDQDINKLTARSLLQVPVHIDGNIEWRPPSQSCATRRWRSPANLNPLVASANSRSPTSTNGRTDKFCIRSIDCNPAYPVHALTLCSGDVAPHFRANLAEDLDLTTDCIGDFSHFHRWDIHVTEFTIKLPRP